MGKKMRKRKLSRKMEVKTGKKLAKERKAKGLSKIRILRESNQDQEQHLFERRRENYGLGIPKRIT
jgi:hypothetical protein